MKIHPVGAQMFHAERQLDRRMDRKKLIVAFCNFVNAPKNTYIHAHSWVRFQDPSVRTVRGSALLHAAILTDLPSITTNTLMQAFIVTFLA